MNKPIYRMSSAGKCPRALSAEKLGYKAEEPPAWLEMAANEGNWHEQRIKQERILEGAYVIDEQLEISIEQPTFILLGHIDGKIASTDDIPNILLEIKSMSQFQFDKWMKQGFDGFPNYAAQLTCYLEATGLEHSLYIVKNRSSGYENRRNIVGKPADTRHILDKFSRVTSSDELLPAEFDSQSIECRRCDYKTLCIPEPKELEPSTLLELTSCVGLWRAGKGLVTKGQEMIDEARETFESHTKATGVDKWKFNGLAINLLHIHKESYPKALLLQHFTKEQLELALKIDDYDQMRIDDLEKEEH